MILKLNNIGDGLFLELTENGNQFITDFGSQQGIDSLVLDNFALMQTGYSSIDFALTHFHKDHYSGLFELEKSRRSTHFSNVFIPRLPKEPEVVQFLQALFAFNSFILGGASGSMDYDFINLVKRINKKSFKICPVSQGDTLQTGNEKFIVSWPPRTLTDDMSKALQRAVNDFRREAEQVPDLKNLYDELEHSDYIQHYFIEEDQEFNNEMQVNKDVFHQQKIRLNLDQEKALKTISNKLRTGANTFSLCYYNHAINFLGDLEPKQINHCLNYILKNSNSNYWDVIVYPHHGTHWHPRLSSIQGTTGLSSNGKKMIVYWKKEFIKISKYNFSTFRNGKFCMKI